MSRNPRTDLALAEQTLAARRKALRTVRDQLRLRLDPRLVVADLAQRTLSIAIGRIATPGLTPKKRKRALATGAAALTTAIVLRTWFKRTAGKGNAVVP